MRAGGNGKRPRGEAGSRLRQGGRLKDIELAGRCVMAKTTTTKKNT
jgi:hypothetical protein